MLQRLVGHHRSEIGTSDADVNDAADSFARVSLPLAASDTFCKMRHFVEHRMDITDDVPSIDKNGRGCWRTSAICTPAVFR